MQGKEGKIIIAGVKYIRFSAIFVLFLILLYIIVWVIGFINTEFYNVFDLLYTLLVGLLLPLYGGILLFFLLYLFSVLVEDWYKNRKKEE